jgi:hypothetical protein
MGKQVWGGPMNSGLKKGSETCPRCGKKVDSIKLLCEKCSDAGGIPYINTGDLPMIMTFLSIILLFIISQMEENGPFHVESLKITLRSWSLLLVSTSGIFFTLYLPFIWKSFLSIDLYKIVFRIIGPLILLSGLISLLVFGITTISMIVVSILLISGLILFSLTFTDYRKAKKTDIILTSISFSFFLAGSLLAIKGNQDFFGIWFIPSSFIVLISGLFFPFSISRMIRFTKMHTRSTLVFPFVFLSLILVTVSIIVQYNSRDIFLKNISWLSTLTTLMITLGAGLSKRIMDSDLNYSFNTGNLNRKKAEEWRKSGDLNYRLHHLDMAISTNPFHGFGDIPENGNSIFRIQGSEGWKTIEMKPDEYVTAHCEKARLLASRGKFVEASREYKSALTKGPDHSRTHYHLSMLLSSIPGKEKESRRNLDIFITSRKHYMQRLLKEPILEYYIFVMNDLFNDYCCTLEEKRKTLSEIGRSGDIWSYYTLMREG